MPHEGVEKSEGPRTGSATRATLAHAPCPESADSCAPVRVASSRVDPPARFADRALAPCHTKGSRNQGQKIACAIAVPLSDTLTDCTRQPAHCRRRFSKVENRSNRPPAPLLPVITNSGAASASGTRYFQDARPYPHQIQNGPVQWATRFSQTRFSPHTRSRPPFRPWTKEGSEFFSETASTAAPRWSILPLEARACRIQAVSALVRW